MKRRVVDWSRDEDEVLEVKLHKDIVGTMPIVWKTA
jgi:hypothetical protein